MFHPHVGLTQDTNYVQFGASELSTTSTTSTTTSHASPAIAMGNCALCEDKLHESEETEPLVAEQSNNFPNSYSYPLFYNPNEYLPTFTGSMTYQRAFTKSCSLSSITPNFKSNFSPSYLDCRLRYIRQTRRIQKYLRITPEGHLLVNDVKQYTRLGSAHNSSCSDDKLNHVGCSTFHPVSSLISVSKLRRIHAAYWNLESRQDLLRSESSTIPEIMSDSCVKTACNGDSNPLDSTNQTNPEANLPMD